MDNYTKGANVEEELTKDNIPIPNLPEKFIWMQLLGGSKMRNVLDYALQQFKVEEAIVWSASGPAIAKAISCAEIVKRHYSLHQITRICYRKVEERWEPKLDGLEPIIVKREVPTIHILLSKLPLDEKELGYQGPLSKPQMSPQPGNTTKKPRSTSRADMLKTFTSRE